MISARESRRIAIIRQEEIKAAEKAKELLTIENAIENARLQGSLNTVLHFAICQEHLDILRAYDYNVDVMENKRSFTPFEVYAHPYLTEISWSTMEDLTNDK